MLVVTARLIVKPDRKEELKQAAESLIAATTREEGCISYRLLQDILDCDTFFFVEEWADKQALDKHFQTPHFVEFGRKIRDILLKKPDIKIYQAEEVK